MKERDYTSNFGVLVTACNTIFSFLQDKEIDVLNLRVVLCFPEGNEGIEVQIIKPFKKVSHTRDKYTKIRMKKNQVDYKLEIRKHESKELLYRIWFGIYNSNQFSVVLCDEKEYQHYKKEKDKKTLDVSL